MHGLIRWFTHNHVAANLLMALILLLGLHALTQRIPLEVFPEFELDLVSVNVALPGATPAEAEESLAIPIEEAILDIEGIKQITSMSAEGASRVSIEVASGYDTYRIKDEIKNRIDALNTLPNSAERPVISQTLHQREVISVTLSAQLSERELKILGERVRDDIQSIEGISHVTLESVRPYEISIEVSEQTLRQYNLTMAQVSSAVQQSSLDLSGGSIKTLGGEILLRTKGQAYQGREFGNIVVRTGVDGSRLLLSDIAVIKDGFDETPIQARFNGEPAVIVEVYRVGQQSAIDVANKVKDYIEQVRPTLPVGVSIDYWRDSSKVVKARLKTLTDSALQGCILVIILLALFLRPSIAFWVTMGIPVSFMGGLLVMPMLGITLNVISLFAFIMVLGILVDDAIVTGENVYAHQQRGATPLQAAIVGTQEVSVPVTFGILTTIAAFAPLAMIEGVRGQIFAQIPLVVVPVLLFSLVESKLILPAHLKHVRLYQAKPNRFSVWQGNFADGFERFILRFYRPVLAAVVHRRYLSIATALGVALVVFTMVASGWTRFVFFPRVPSETVRATLVMPAGTAFATTDFYIQKMLDGVAQLQDKYRDPVTGDSVILDVFATSGSDGGGGSGDTAKGRVMFELEPPETRTMDISTNELVKEWRALIGPVPGVESLSFRAEIGRGGAPLDVQLSARDFSTLKPASDDLKRKLAEYPGVFDIEDSLAKGKTELQLSIKPQAQALGLTLRDLATQVRQGFFGDQVQRIQRGRDDVKVYVRYPKAERESLFHLQNMLIRTQSGTAVPFTEVATVTVLQSPASITRKDRKRVINITADVNKETADIEAIKRDISAFLVLLKQQYPDLSYSLEGEAKEQSESFTSLAIGLVFVLFAIYALLAIPFKSYTQPFVVMSVIPFGAIGAIMGHWIMGMPLTIMSMMGMLALTGVVVNDSLVLVDYINRQRSKGMAVKTAVRRAGVARFRAVILTSITTFAGLMPLIFDQSTQAQFLIPMAVSLGFGIIFATVITLLLVPVNYLLLEDLKIAVHRLQRNVFAGSTELS
ncbi:efflux RND transporter permease subunit [Motilimonas sp. 1_MG-2023]|uniref:efflux RND transporter permease subunit n=1 Tax=Motilimonas sp. 1_MG-2023 TaxID=3062672 RepID=UPI0026E17F82|nr:efflux RND transporter permease subunit [Motilimonas sp. 1_MG-2023]MDO6527556.1 efflux RND transporter permease subunit [Motilimonas sp. 1_MG-2023]